MRAVTVDITPSEPLPMAGFTTSSAQAEGIHDRLEANILFMPATPQALCLVSLDTLYAGDLAARLGMLSQTHNVQVFTAASHTHYAPATSTSLPQLGTVNSEWLDRVTSQIVSAIESAAAQPAPSATPRIQRARATAPVGRRRRRRGVRILRGRPWFYRGVVNAPDHRSAAVEEIDVVSVGDPDKPLALLWSVSCHPTASPFGNYVTSEFIGRVRDRLRQHYGAIPILFLQGGAGDVRPLVSAPTGPVRIAKEVLALLGPPPWISPAESDWSAWCDRIADAIVRVGFSEMGEPATPGFGGESSIELGMTNRGGPVELRASRLVLSPTIALLGFNAELMSSHGPFVRELLGCNDVVYGYAGEVFGYLPRTEMMPDGGYEVDLHFDAFGLRGKPHPDPDRCVRELLGTLRSQE